MPKETGATIDTSASDRTPAGTPVMDGIVDAGIDEKPSKYTGCDANNTSFHVGVDNRTDISGDTKHNADEGGNHAVTTSAYADSHALDTAPESNCITEGTLSRDVAVHDDSMNAPSEVPPVAAPIRNCSLNPRQG